MFKISIWLMSRTGIPYFACAVIYAFMYTLLTYTSSRKFSPLLLIQVDSGLECIANTVQSASN